MLTTATLNSLLTSNLPTCRISLITSKQRSFFVFEVEPELPGPFDAVPHAAEQGIFGPVVLWVVTLPISGPASPFRVIVSACSDSFVVPPQFLLLLCSPLLMLLPGSERLVRMHTLFLHASQILVNAIISGTWPLSPPFLILIARGLEGLTFRLIVFLFSPGVRKHSIGLVYGLETFRAALIEIGVVLFG